MEEVDGATFQELESLQELSLRNNAIKALQNGTFRHLRHLKMLDLSGGLDEVDIRNERFFPDLVGIDVSHN